MNGNPATNAQVTRPLARRLLTMVAMLSIAVTGVATAAAFFFVRESAAEIMQMLKGEGRTAPKIAAAS